MLLTPIKISPAIANRPIFGVPPAIPTAPTVLSVSVVSDTELDLVWVDNSGNEDSFLIERSLDGVIFAQIASVGSNIIAFSDTGLNPSTLYYYRVRASNGGGNSAYTNIDSATTNAGGATGIGTFAIGSTFIIG